MPFNELLEKIAKEIWENEGKNSQKSILYILRKYMNPFPAKQTDTFMEKFNTNEDTSPWGM